MISISLANIFRSTVVSKASAFFLMMLAVALSDYIPKIKFPISFLFMGAC